MKKHIVKQVVGLGLATFDLPGHVPFMCSW